MIDVEIKGPVAKKEYDKLRKTLAELGENIVSEKRVNVVFLGEHHNAFTDIEVSSGTDAKIILKDQKLRTQTVLNIPEYQFSHALEFCAKLGYTKGIVSMREFLCANYGGAYFSLVVPADGISFYYEALISANDPVTAKEAQKKLEALARKFKLPIWGNLQMLAFFEKLNKQANSVYDYKTQGADYFKKNFGI